MKFQRNMINHEAIIFGFFSCCGGAVFFGILVSVIMAIVRASSISIVNGIFVSALFSVLLGGFVTGRVAKKNEMLNACITGIISLSGGLLLFVVEPQRFEMYNAGYMFVGHGLYVPLAAVGGYFAMRMNRNSVLTV